jgi:indolepyruvate decarboxylase
MKTTVAQYIVARLQALGVRHLFQIPGNYTSDFLKAADKSGAIACINTTNELEAGYAADAYARLHGIGVACVTMGVGSFSAYNAIAGAFVEFCPVLLLNGSARRSKVEQMLRQGVLYAHAIDRERTDELIYQPVTAARAVITSGENAPAAIDHVLRTMLTVRRPVYLEVHDLVWTQECDAPADPAKKLEPYPPSDDESRDMDQTTAAAAGAVATLLRDAKKPVLWGGEELQRLRLEEDFARLVQVTGLPYVTTLMGKGLLPEDTNGFMGVYDSAFAPPEVRSVVEDSDLVVALGTILGDFYGGIVQKQYATMVLASAQAVRTGESFYPNAPLQRFLPKLVDTLLAEHGGGASSHEKPHGYAELMELRGARGRAAPAGFQAAATGTKEGGSNAETAPVPLTWDTFFARLHGFITPDMLVLADTSVALFPSAGLPILRARRFIAQTVWLSIGYTVGAIVGVSHYLPPGERAVAIVGDGGFQMMPQAISTLARYRKPAIVFVCDNGLYAIEQFLIDAHYFSDPDESKKPLFFNQLASWDYEALATAFGAWGRKVATMDQLDTALEEAVALQDRPALIAVKLPPKDLPAALEPRPAAGLIATAAIGKTGSTINTAAFD